MEYLGAIWEVITGAIGEFTTALGGALQGITSLFVTTTETGVEMTFVGVLLLIAAGVGIVYFVFNLIKGLVRRA